MRKVVAVAVADCPSLKQCSHSKRRGRVLWVSATKRWSKLVSIVVEVISRLQSSPET